MARSRLGAVLPVFLLVVLLLAGKSARGDEPTLESAAAWLKKIGVRLGSKDHTPTTLKELTFLDLSTADRTQLVDEDLAQLRALPKLSFVELSGVPVSDAAAELIAGLPGLTGVRLTGSTLSDKGLATLVRAPGLNDLTLDGVKTITDEGVRSLRESKKLRFLSLSNTKVTDDGLAALAGAPNLLHLQLNGCTAVTDAGLVHVGAIPTLVRLDLASLTLEKGIAELKRLPALKALLLTGAKVSDTALVSLSELKLLEELYLAKTLITDVALESIGKVETLRTLYLDDCSKITSAGLAHLKGLKNLQVLWLGGTAADDEGMRHLADLPALETLKVTGTKVSDACIEELARSPRLYQFNYSGSKITRDGIARLKVAKPKINAW